MGGHRPPEPFCLQRLNSKSIVMGLIPPKVVHCRGRESGSELEKKT